MKIRIKRFDKSFPLPAYKSLGNKTRGGFGSTGTK